MRPQGWASRKNDLSSRVSSRPAQPDMKAPMGGMVRLDEGRGKTLPGFDDAVALACRQEARAGLSRGILGGEGAEVEAVERAIGAEVGLLNIRRQAADELAVLQAKLLITGESIGLALVRGELNGEARAG